MEHSYFSEDSDLSLHDLIYCGVVEADRSFSPAVFILCCYWFASVVPLTLPLWGGPAVFVLLSVYLSGQYASLHSSFLIFEAEVPSSQTA